MPYESLVNIPVETAKRSEWFMSVVAERDKQRLMWGDDHDDQHTALEWAGILAHEVGDFAKTIHSPKRLQRALVKIAAVCLAAHESIERMTK